jgi:hypothetical protein
VDLGDLRCADTVDVTKRTLSLACAAVALVLLGGCTASPEPTDAKPPAVGGLAADGERQSAGSPVEESAELPQESTAPRIETRTVTKKARVSYASRTVEDSSLRKGTRKVRTKGVAGVRTLTYRVTLTNGRQTAKKLIKSEVTRRPITKVVAIGTKEAEPPLGSGSGCDPNYSGACVPVASDVDCAGGSGNGPKYVDGPVRVVGTDIYDLDRDGDGIACDA